jgi:hypothetical protein
VDEVQISKVAAVLAEWNPLGSRADSVSDLDGYRIEAIDIIMALGVFRRFVAPTSIPKPKLLTFIIMASTRLKLSTCFQAQGRIVQVGKGRG